MYLFSHLSSILTSSNLAIWNQLYSSLTGPNEACLQLTNINGNNIYVNQFESFSRFNSLIKLFKLVVLHALVETPRNTTIRDIYYKDTVLFALQDNCKKNLHLLFESSLGFSLKNDLYIYPSQKGLIYGNTTATLKFITSSNTNLVEFHRKMDPILIPIFDTVKITGGFEKTIVIVLEKEAVFKSLCEVLRNESPECNIFLITGKGNPDLLSKRFLSTFGDSPNVRFKALVDSDIYGISIFRQYQKFCSRLEFSGVHLLSYKSGWMNITRNDHNLMVCSLLRENECRLDGEFKERSDSIVQREITRGLFLYKKAEMNSLNGFNEFAFSE